MTDGDHPPTGHLARLRAQLAGPRGYRRIDALLSADDAAGAVAQLAPAEIYELVHEVGWEDAQDLIALATPAQIQGCIDLDGWSQDQLEVAALKPWLAAVMEAGFEKLGQVWSGLDNELRALVIQRQVKVYDTSLGEAPADDNDEPIYTTPDRFFLLELSGDDETQRLVQNLVEELYRADPDLARHAIMAARSEPPAELEEMAYRWRAGRLADEGYGDFYEALDLFKPLAADQVHVGEGSQDRTLDDDEARLPVAVAEEVVATSFLARAMAMIDTPAESERLERALVVLVNKVLAAARAKPGQAEVVRRGARYATATLSLGLETVTRGELERARAALASVGLVRLFRVGYTVGRQLGKLAAALATRATTAGTPAKELVAALTSPRPLFACAADVIPQGTPSAGGAAPGLRPLASQADVRRASEILAALAIRVALVEGLGVDVVAMGQLPEPRPELDDHARTALARAVVGGELRGEALTQAELTELRRRGFASGKLTAEARRAGHDAIRTRLGAGQLAVSGPVLARLVDGWLDDLERILGGVTDAEIDPRFVEGLIVEVKRS